MARVENKKIKAKNYSRRDFLVGGGAVIAVDAFSATAPAAAALTESASPVAAGTSYAESKGYLLYDSKKCAGCVTCMLACSLVHEGEENLSLARIQIAQSSFAKFPDDIKIAVCRQCVTPVCVQNCPMKALKFVAETPNQTETDGYDVNLRNEHWLNLGLVDNMSIVPPSFAAAAAEAPQAKTPPKQ